MSDVSGFDRPNVAATRPPGSRTLQPRSHGALHERVFGLTALRADAAQGGRDAPRPASESCAQSAANCFR